MSIDLAKIVLPFSPNVVEEKYSTVESKEHTIHLKNGTHFSSLASKRIYSQALALSLG